MARFDEVLPKSIVLHQNHPNPFNPSTTIQFELPKSSNVSLAVYNLLGQKVATLVDDFLSGGRYSVVWNSRSDAGDQCSSGVYFYRLTHDVGTVSKKMVLLK